MTRGKKSSVVARRDSITPAEAKQELTRRQALKDRGLEVKPLAERMVMQIEEPANFSEVMTESHFGAASTVLHLWGDVSPGGMLHLTEFAKAIKAKAESVAAGDTKHAEQMLTAQSITLDHLFNVLTQRAVRNIHAGYRDAGEVYLRLALRCQSQSARNWESLAALKNPPTVFAKQANVAGQQVNQVNNFTGAGGIERSPNELLEMSNGERLDTVPAGQAARIDTPLAAVDPIDRPKNATRQAQSIAERTKDHATTRIAARGKRTAQ